MNAPSTAPKATFTKMFGEEGSVGNTGMSTMRVELPSTMAEIFSGNTSEIALAIVTASFGSLLVTTTSNSSVEFTLPASNISST